MTIRYLLTLSMAVVIFASCGDITEPPKPVTSLSISPADPTFVLESWEGSEVRFTARATNLVSAETEWYLNGTPTGVRGTTYEPTLTVGTHQVEARNSNLTARSTAKANLPSEMTVRWYLARAEGGELLSSGTRLNVSPLGSGGSASESLSSGSNFSLSFPSGPAGVRVCLELDVYPKCQDVVGDEVFSPTTILSLVEKGWKIQVGTYTGTVQDISMALGFEETGRRNISGTPDSFLRGNPLLYSPDPLLHVRIVRDSLSDQAVEKVKADLTASYRRLGWSEPIFLSEGDGREECATVTIRGTSSGTGAVYRACNLARWPTPGKITGGFIQINPAQLNSCTVEHELWHVLGFGHTNSWPSIEYDQGYCSPSRGNTTATAMDMAMREVWNTVLALVAKYPEAGIRNPLLPWAIDWFNS